MQRQTQGCPFCTESTYGKYCIEHEMEKKHYHRLRERNEMEELSYFVAVCDHLESMARYVFLSW